MKKNLIYLALILMLAMAVPSITNAQCVSDVPTSIELHHSYCLKVCPFDTLYNIQIQGVFDGPDNPPTFILEPGCHTEHCNVDCTPISVPLVFHYEYNPVPYPHYEYHGTSDCLDIVYYWLHTNVWVIEVYSFCPGCFCLTFDHQLPVQLSSFAAVASNQNITLRWATASEQSTDKWVIERKETESGDYTAMTEIAAAGNSSSVRDYSWVDTQVRAGVNYRYRLSVRDINGSISHFDNNVQSAILGSSNAGIPTVYALQQNYPNPFNPSTTFEFDVAHSGYTTLKVFDLQGREVATVVQGELSANHYSVNWNADKLSTGVYFYTLKSGNFSATKKLVLMK